MTSLVAFIGGLHWGIVGVSVGFAITSTFVEPYYTSLTGKAIGLSLTAFLRNLSGIAQAAAGMFVVVLAVRLGAEHAGVGQTERLILAVTAGCVVYPLLCLWRAPEVFEEIHSLRRRRKPPAPPFVLTDEVEEPAAAEEREALYSNGAEPTQVPPDRVVQEEEERPDLEVASSSNGARATQEPEDTRVST